MKEARLEFLRRTGALGLAGAAALGYTLAEEKPASAESLPPAKDVIAAGGGVTVKLGYVDSFSGVYAAAGASQETGIRLAIREAEARNSRIKYELLRGDDNSKPAVGTNEAKRLINQERVDTLMGGLSSAVGLALSATAEEHGTLFIAIGTHDSNITGMKANRVCFRTCPNNSMLSAAVAPEMLRLGKKWYFLVADYAFGTDAYNRLKRILLAQGGQEVGVDLHPLGATDYSAYMTKARNTDAEVMVYCNYGPDTQNSTKAFVALGLHKKMHAAGIVTGNEVAVGMPVDDLVGTVWGVDWGPDAGGNAAALYAKLKPLAKDFPPNWRQYLGYIAGQQLIDRLNAAGTTDTEALVKAFEGHTYDGAKKLASQWRACDHQNVQETYVARIVPKSKRRSEDEYFEIVDRVGGDFAAGPCSNPDSAAAHEIFAAQKIPVREGYTTTRLRS
ncbi:MAG: ABC transporter substrate-binding protein [Candidatus Eremiobacteraeota bacterium]|nr:ABC transporter substrate-binding protein [Candidatus Eremiobacteraeota bacterium]